MEKGKKFLKEIIPPIILSTLKGKQVSRASASFQPWTGDYASWEEAEKHITGYDGEAILEKCRNSLLKIKNGEAAYERDSILFDQVQYSWALLAALQRAALENNGELCVLDFGGSLGSTYFQNREFLRSLKKLTWCIVEQPNFVTCGKTYFENEQLKFYHTIEECLSQQHPNVVFASCVLQYLEKPFEVLNLLLTVNAPYLVLDRLALSYEKRDILTVQHVPAQFYKSELGHWFFSHDKMIAKLNSSHELLAAAPSFADEDYLLNQKTNCFFNLFLLKRR